MNLQDILTIVIVLLAFSYALFGLVKLLTPAKSGKSAGCSGCTACSGQENLPNGFKSD